MINSGLSSQAIVHVCVQANAELLKEQNHYTHYVGMLSEIHDVLGA